MLKHRVITGAILAVIVIGSIVYGDIRWVSLLFALVLLLATRELLALTVKLPAGLGLLFSSGFALIFWWSLTLVTPAMVYWQVLMGAVQWLLIGCGLYFYRPDGNWNLLTRSLVFLLGLNLLWICVHGLVYLHHAYGWQALLFLFSLVWIADVGAYFSGRQFGKRKLAVNISPGKTWEGVLGGIAANLVWMLSLSVFYGDWYLSLTHLLSIGLATCAISVVGDLFESILKREAGVKDSGKLLPGHGGVLDRIDSVIAASPVFVTGLLWFGQS